MLPTKQHERRCP